MGIRAFVKSFPPEVQREIDDKEAHWVTYHGKHIVIEGSEPKSGERSNGRVLFEPGNSPDSHDDDPKVESVNDPTIHTSKVTKALQGIERKIRHNKNESGYIVTHDGRHIWSQQGESDHVDVSEAVKRGLQILLESPRY